MKAFEVGRRHDAVEIAEGALVLHFLGGVEQAGHRGAIERGGEADALHAGGLELGLAENDFLLMPTMKLNGFSSALRDLLDRREIGQARREQHVGARRLESLQARDHVVEVGLAAQEALGARRQHERERQRAAPPSTPRPRARPRLRGRRAARPCCRSRPRSSRRPGRRRPRCRIVSAAASRRVAEALLEIADHRQVDGARRWRAHWPATPRASPCRRACRARRPWRRSRSPAPGSRAPASTRAEPASHGLAMTKAPGASCSARNFFALSAWLTLMLFPLGRRAG